MTAAEPARYPEAIEALNRINEIATKFCESQMFFAACELGVFDRLSAGPVRCEDLAGLLGVHPDPCRRLLIGLAQMELLHREGDTFSNSPVAAYLAPAAPVPLET